MFSMARVTRDPEPPKSGCVHRITRGTWVEWWEDMHPSHRRRARSIAALVPLVLLISCGVDDPVPRRVKARLESVLGLTPKTPTKDDVREALMRQLRTTGPASKEMLDEFYARHGHQLIWSDASGKLLPSTRALLEALRHAEEHGLIPEDYAVGRLESLEKELATGDADTRAAHLADFDLLATAAFFRYASDVSTGRVHPDEVDKNWHTNPPELDLAKALDDALAANMLPKLIESLPPPHPGYARLREALAKLRAGQAVNVTATATEPPALPIPEQIRQVELNLERWRWIPRQLGDTHILVNIPAFDLELVEGEAIPWKTRVVAGKAFTPTPVFSDKVVAIVANPPWNVPESIAINEYLPELQKDRNALKKHGLTLLEGAGDKEREIDPDDVNWKEMGTDRFPYHIRQDPGATNPLGRVKFDLTNDFSIYLHDTPGRGAFKKTDRDLSHGCIRVENAIDLAHRITHASDREQLDEALGKPEEKHIPLASKVPVHILYWTAWADENGQLQFGPDVYGFDKSQRAALDRVSGAGAPAM
jgi:murein L,D-transpeptidase YcbB/YkuD